MQLVMELTNNTRIWENNGHTPQEFLRNIKNLIYGRHWINPLGLARLILSILKAERKSAEMIPVPEVEGGNIRGAAWRSSFVRLYEKA